MTVRKVGAGVAGLAALKTFLKDNPGSSERPQILQMIQRLTPPAPTPTPTKPAKKRK